MMAMRRWMKGLIVGVVVGGLGALFGVTNLGAEFEKHVGLTWMFKIRGPIEAPPNVAVIAINEHTAAKLDLPPLPRDWPRSSPSAGWTLRRPSGRDFPNNV